MWHITVVFLFTPLFVSVYAPVWDDDSTHLVAWSGHKHTNGYEWKIHDVPVMSRVAGLSISINIHHRLPCIALPWVCLPPKNCWALCVCAVAWKRGPGKQGNINPLALCHGHWLASINSMHVTSRNCFSETCQPHSNSRVRTHVQNSNIQLFFSLGFFSTCWMPLFGLFGKITDESHVVSLSGAKGSPSSLRISLDSASHFHIYEGHWENGHQLSPAKDEAWIAHDKVLHVTQL